MADDYDLTVFTGRLSFFSEMVHPRFFFAGDEDIKKAQEELKKGTASASEMKTYQKLVESTVHGPSGDIIPRFGRVSAIAPVNIPLVSLMLTCPASNVPGTLFLHWANQTYNAYCNYCNRAGKEVDVNESMKAYGLAVGSACTLAYGLGKAFERAPPRIKRFGVLIPMLATGAANFSNLGFSRMGEIVNGTTVYDEEKNDRGLSKVAGLQGVVQTGFSRGLMVPSACLLIPVVAESIFGKLKLLPKAGGAGIKIFQLTWICFALQGALPAALAVFPQTSTYEVAELEPQFHFLVDSKNKPVKQLFANKGL